MRLCVKGDLPVHAKQFENGKVWILKRTIITSPQSFIYLSETKSICLNTYHWLPLRL